MATIAGVNNLTGTQTDIDKLVAQFKAQKLIPEKKLEDKKSTLNTKISTYSDVKSKFNDLLTSAKGLISSNLATPASTEKFELKTASSSNSDVLTVTSNAKALENSYSVFVKRLAQVDTILSNQFSSDGSEIVTDEGTGIKNFTITVNGSPTDVSVTLDGGETNKEVIQKIVAAIKSSNAPVKSQTFGDTASTSRLLINAKSSGKDNAITYSDTSGTLLATLGLTAAVNTARTQYTSTMAGFITSSSNNLDASFQLNGVDIQRSSNTVSDLLDGITINLKKAQALTDSPVTISTSLDKEAVRGMVDKFISTYNDTLTSVGKVVDRTKKGALSGDSGYMGILNSIRSMINTDVDSISTVDGPTNIIQLGIKIGNDGTLSISDKEKFDSLLSQNPAYVADIFVGTEASGFVFEANDGIAHQLKNYLTDLTGINGQIKRSTDSAQTQIRSLDKQIQRFKDKVDVQAEKFRNDYTKILNSVKQLTDQQNAINQFLGSGSGS